MGETLPQPREMVLPTDEERARRKAGADLCARHPATWSAMVAYEDQLLREGWTAAEAREVAWAFYVEGRRVNPRARDSAPQPEG